MIRTMKRKAIRNRDSERVMDVLVDKDKDKIVRYGLTSDLNPFYCSFRCMHYLDFINYLKNIREYYQKLFTKKNSNKILTTNDLKHESEELHYFMNSLKND